MKIKKILILSIITSLCLTGCSTPNNEDNKVENNKTGVQILEGSKRDTAIKNIEEQLESLKTTGQCIEINIGEENPTTYVFNTSDECLSQHVYTDTETNTEMMRTVVFRNDGNAVIYDDHLSFGPELDILSEAELALEMAKLGVGVVVNNPQDYSNQVLEEGQEQQDYLEYFIDIRGYNNIQNTFNLFNKSYSYSKVEDLRSLAGYMKTTDSGDILDIEHINLRYVFLINKTTNELYGISSWIYFGTEDSENMNGDTLRTLWTTLSIHPIDDWKIDETWYTNNWSDLLTWEDEKFNEAEEMLSSLYEEVLDVLARHFGSSLDEYKETHPENN